jgi:hypothetical protein
MPKSDFTTMGRHKNRDQDYFYLLFCARPFRQATHLPSLRHIRLESTASEKMESCQKEAIIKILVSDDFLHLTSQKKSCEIVTVHIIGD